MAPKTTSQHDVALAHRLVGTVAEKSEGVRRIYAGLCHDFPFMVLQSGPAQAAAHHEAKAHNTTGDRAAAHGLLLEHMAVLLGEQNLVENLESVSPADYLRATQRLLSGAIYLKRLAVIMLEAAPDSSTRASQHSMTHRSDSDTGSQRRNPLPASDNLGGLTDSLGSL